MIPSGSMRQIILVLVFCCVYSAVLSLAIKRVHWHYSSNKNANYRIRVMSRPIQTNLWRRQASGENFETLNILFRCENVSTVTPCQRVSDMRHDTP